MARGTVKTVKPDRGFGFLRPDGADADLFFHVNDTAQELGFDERLVERIVLFDEALDERSGKQRAVNVRAI